ncbi:MAG TPA: FimV/HubP family polar landmark protein [Gammaproteobacteria bacterium]
MRRYLALALACVLAAISVSALAMGLGEIRLNSYLNQRLDAEIELVSAAADELESLEIGLADHAAFERIGLIRNTFLNSLQFRVVRRPNGTAYVHVTSKEPVREPFLTLLVQADWSRGRLLREYTLLIDPPAFAGREQAPAAETQAPAVTPAPAPVEQPVELAPQPTPVDAMPAETVSEQAPVEETATGDLVTIPPLEADAETPEPVSQVPAYVEPRMGGNYGPIQRNETLWGIAQRLRPDESVTINQMMLAVYRANPEAFQGNINRLKAGYILRIPEYSEIVAQGRRDAFLEVKRQNEEWSAGSSSSAPSSVDFVEPAEPASVEPELSLVAPQEDIEPEADAAIGADEEGEGLGTGSEEPVDLAEEDIEEDAVDLGVEDETDDRLLDLEDESMQALQEQDEVLLPEESAELPLPLPEETPAEEPAEQAAAEEIPGAEGAQDEAPAQAEAEGESEPAPVVAPPVQAEPDLVERLIAFARSPLGMGIGAAILVLLLAGALVARKRRSAAQAGAAAAMSEWNDEEDYGSDVTVVAGSGDEDATRDDGGDIATVFAHGMDHQDTGTTRLEDDAEATQLLADADKTRVMSDVGKRGGPDFSETVVGGQAVTLDENDPLSEADFHMAYGLYDQAAEVVEKAVQRDPSRKDFHAKLAEIYFAANNTSGFLEAARRLREVAGPGDPAWDNIAIMGRQMAPGNDLFADSGSTAAVDLDFGSADTEFSGEETLVKSESEPPAPADDSLDFDIALDTGSGPPAAEEKPASGMAASDDMDFDLDIGEPAAGTGKAPAAESNDFDFDLGGLDAGAEEADADVPAPAKPMSDDEETQTEFDKALQELSAFVDTNLPEQDAGDAIDAGMGQDADLNLDEYNFDGDSEGGSYEDAAGSGEDEGDIGEIGTKLDLARAYIDMGDPDGARGILEEVMSDGDADQQKEARELLDQLA